MLVLAILSILQLGSVINQPIWSRVFGKEITPERSVSRLDALYNKFEELSASHENPIPVWTRAPKQVTKVTEESREPLIGTQKHDQSVVSEPWPKRVLVTPFKNPLILAINTGTGQMALKIHRKKIIEAERKVLVALSRAFYAMSDTHLGLAEHYLNQAVKQDIESQSLQKRYYEVNAPVIDFNSNEEYKSEYRGLIRRKNFFAEINQEDMIGKLEHMHQKRRDMEKKWKSGDSRLPDPTNVVLRHDLATSHKKAALRNAIIALAHETSGQRSLNDKKATLAYFHWTAANKYYTRANEEMDYVYGTQHGFIDLGLNDDYKKMAIDLEEHYPFSSINNIEGTVKGPIAN